MSTNIAKICILLFVLAPVFAFDARMHVYAGRLQASTTTRTTGEMEAVPGNTETITKSASTRANTNVSPPAKEVSLQRALGQRHNETTIIISGRTTTATRITIEAATAAAAATAETVKSEMVSGASPSSWSSASGTTSTATPTTTATTSTTTAKPPLAGMSVREHAKQLAETNGGNEANTEIDTARDVTEADAGDVQVTTSSIANAHDQAITMTELAKEAAATTINKLDAPDVGATETLVMATAATPAKGPDPARTNKKHDNLYLPSEIRTASDPGIAVATTTAIAAEELPSTQYPKGAMQDIEVKAYQVPETLATEYEQNADKYFDANSEDARVPSKLNIVDLYPLKIEDFKPIIRVANEQLLAERTIFTQPQNAEEYRQNLMPNEVEIVAEYGVLKQRQRRPTQQEEEEEQQKQQQHNLPQQPTSNKSVNRATVTGGTISDFTGKLLAEQDGVITEIEQKFRLHELQSVETTTNKATLTASAGLTAIATATGTAAAPKPHYTFIDRRVKKSFDFPMHRVASDVMSLPHTDFANTKFNTDVVHDISGKEIRGTQTKAASVAHPEFSTTKFFNSKELYNEMLLHNNNKRKLIKEVDMTKKTKTKPEAETATTDSNREDMIIKSTRATSVMTSALRKLKSSAASLATDADSGDLSKLATPATQIAAPAAITSVSTTRFTIVPTKIPLATSRSETLAATSPTTLPPLTTTTTTTEAASTTKAQTVTLRPNRYQKQLKRAKLLLMAILPTNVAATETIPTSEATTLAKSSTSKLKFTKSNNVFVTTSVIMPDVAAAMPTVTLPTEAATTAIQKASITKSAVAVEVSPPVSAVSTPTRFSSSYNLSQRHILNPLKSVSKPIARPRILSRLQEKINSLECELQNVPPDSHLWRGNETHELLLPIVTTEHCRNVTAHQDCTPEVVSWQGEAEIQSGDILIVEINDIILNPNAENITSSAHAAQVYQVTRSGHEHCDVTEGILLDITPLVVDGRKLVTLYDKDLTEGVNLLIVVSELWGTQCVRLKVTTKTDNCGENADCSGKGVCYSNPVMEEYECQCCSGFAGPHCEEIDACNPSPCTNNGICVDLSQGHEGNSYQCLCPYGYTGKNCQYESDPCNPAECMNGGSCVGNSTHFRCDCTPGYTGPLCQHSLNECESSPCVHGICVDQEDGFRCFCQPGFAGELCNFEYNECESNPCQNSGECIDHIGSYECRCTKGYTGNRCQIKVDFCANKPCSDGQRCIDHGNDFSCECPGGRNGPDCNQMPRTQCNVNPCTHGGTCWSSGESFYCACRPGYTGTMCEDEFVVETVVSSSEFIVDDTSTRNFNDKTFGSSVVLKSPIELHNAYFAAGVLAAAIFIVAVVVTICHCKVNQTYRKFSTRPTSFIPILGFSRRPKLQSKLNKHWLSGKGLGVGGGGGSIGDGGSLSGTGVGVSCSGSVRSNATSTRHLPQPNAGNSAQPSSTAVASSTALGGRQLHERPFQRHLAMNLENDMYYTVDFSENSQHSPLIQ